MAAEQKLLSHCTSGHVAAQFNRHGNYATVTVDTVVLCKFQAACVSKITVEVTTFLSCGLMSKMKYIGECCGCFTACDVKRSCSIGWAVCKLPKELC